MNGKISTKYLLAALGLVLVVCAIASAQKKPLCVAEVEKILVEAENTESYQEMSGAAADECVRQNAKSAEALAVRSKVLALKGDFAAAFADAGKAIELAPQRSEAFYARGFVYDKKFWKNFDKNDSNLAMADYEKALALNPQNGVALLAKTVLTRSNMGSGFRTLFPDFDRAIEYLTASGNTAEAARAYYERGNAKTLSYMWDDGIADLATALKIRPGYLSPLHLRATAHAIRTDKPNIAAAIADYTEYLKVKPGAYTYNQRAGLYEKMGETAKAVSDYRAALRLEPDNSRAKESLAQLAPATAAPAPTTPTSPAPTAEQYAADGRMYAGQKKFDEAIKAFSECLRLKTDAAACYAFRGYSYGMKGDLSRARTDFETAIKLEPNQPAIYFVRGMMYAELGTKEEAVKDFRAVLKIDPNNQQAKGALQKLGVQP